LRAYVSKEGFQTTAGFSPCPAVLYTVGSEAWTRNSAGKVKEVRTGVSANEKRGEPLSLAEPERRKAVERFLSSFLQGFTLQDYSIENLENYDQELVLRYAFEAPVYAKQMGELWLVRPRVLGAKSNMNFEGEDRKYPLELDAVSVQT
jgi:hypothetical protein